MINEARHKERRYIGNSPLAALALMNKNNDKDFVSYDGDVIALDVIRGETESLQRSIDALLNEAGAEIEAIQDVLKDEIKNASESSQWMCGKHCCNS